MRNIKNIPLSLLATALFVGFLFFVVIKDEVRGDVTLVSSGQQVDLTELLPATLEDADGNVVDRDSLEGKVIGIYFTASWCPPCRNFTPRLVDVRNANQDFFEIVVVSGDESEAAQRKYMKDYGIESPVVPFGTEAVFKIADTLRPRGFPTLVIFAPDGRILSTDGYRDLLRNPAQSVQSWRSAVAQR